MSIVVTEKEEDIINKLEHPELIQDASSSPPPPPPKYIAFMAGMFSGIAKNAVGHPMDVLKCRLQTAPQGQFKGVFDCFGKL